MNLKDIYDKMFMGDFVSNDELHYFITEANKVIPVLAELGPVYRTAMDDLRTNKDKAESFLKARSVSTYLEL